MMRFVKVFLLLGLFGFCALSIDVMADKVGKWIPVSVFSSKEEAIAFAQKFDDGFRKGGAEWESAKQMNKEYLEKVGLRYRLFFWGQVVVYIIFLLFATMLYLRAAPKRS